MKQQINLYQPIFRKQRHLLSAVAMMQGVGVVLLGLGLISGYAAWQLARLGAEHERLAADRAAAEARLVNLEKLIPQRAKSPRIADRRARLERQLDVSRELLQTLSRREIRSSGGFADYLEGLARQRVEGLWLTAFDIADGGRYVQIAGSAVRPELVPKFVQRLSEEPSFRGMTFSSLTIKRDDGATRRVDFELHTVTDEQ